MKILNPEDCIQIGTFLKPHGISGRVMLQYELEWEWSLREATMLLVEFDGLPVPWFVREEGIQIVSEGIALIDLEWIDSEMEAKRVCGRKVFLTRDQTIRNREHEAIPDWVGYDIFSATAGWVGTITGEENYSGNLVFTVQTPSGERLIPYHSELFMKADTKKKKLTLHIAEGLLDI